MVERRLFGTVGAEILYRSVVEVYEHVIENTYDPGVEVEVEEWTVADNRQFLPDSKWVLNHVVDYLADTAVVEEWYENAEKLIDDESINGVFTAALETFADRMTFWMADKHVASHWVVTGDNPMVDGKPMYERRKE